LFWTQNRDFLLDKRCTTHQQNNKTTCCFLFLVYKVNVRFNFRSRHTQAVMQVSSAILFVSLLSCVMIEKAIWKIMNTEHIFSAKPLKRSQLPGSTPPGCGSGYPSIISKCFLRISVNFPYVFPCLVLWCFFKKNSVGTDITCNLTRHWGLLPVEIKLSVFLWHMSFDTYFWLNCYTWLNITSLLPQCTSDVARKVITESMLAAKIKK